ncbi:MAG: hypothetical protein MJ246_03695 [Clostridia bacterium]|nr:hypothetical protein [Clostridia bacterium]
MYTFDSDGVIGALVYLSALSDKFQINFAEVLNFNKNFIEACNKVEQSQCNITRDDVINLCLEHGDILSFDDLTNSIYVKRDMNSVIMGLYGYTMYIAGTGARIIFNDVFNDTFKKVKK